MTYFAVTQARLAQENKMATHRQASQNDGSSNIPSSSAGATASGDQNEEHNANFECNICLDTAKDAVISLCGHLFW